MQERLRVVFVSRRDSLRSVMAAACLTRLDGVRLVAHSCGVPGQIAPAIDAAAIAALASAGIPLPRSHPTSWNALLHGPALRFNFVIALDETVAGLMPPWPGQPDIATWSFPDVAARADPEQAERLAVQILYSLRRRLELLIALTVRSSDRAAIQSDIRDLGHVD